MTQRIVNGSFGAGTASWSLHGPAGTITVDPVTGNAIDFSVNNTAVGSSISQTVNITPNGAATFTCKYGKVGSATGAVGIRVRISYIDTNGNTVYLVNQTGTDSTGPINDNRNPAALD